MQSSDPTYSAPPFPAFPCTSRYVSVGSVGATVQRVCRSIDAHETLSLVIGPPGTGKSLICRLLAERYRGTYDVITLGEARIESQEVLLKYILHQLQRDAKGSKDELHLQLVDYLGSDQSAPEGLLLLLDEAQSLSVEVIESIRMVTNIMHRGEPRVSAVLFGGVKLDEMLIDSALESFSQRITTRCYLHPMNCEETRQYISETIRDCGAPANETITDDAIIAIHHACNGVPRLINQMMTQAIDCAAEMDQSRITEQIVDQAWAQLQQLPSPMVDEPKLAKDAAPVEFGELDETIPTSQEVTNERFGSGADDSGEKFGPSEESPSVVCADFESMFEVDSVTIGAEAWEEPPREQYSQGDAGASRRESFGQVAAVRQTLSTDELFGEFDEEEEVVIGRRRVEDVNPGSGEPSQAFIPTQHATGSFNEDDLTSAIAGDQITNEYPLDATVDLEESLHQEVIGLSQLARLAQDEANSAIIAMQTDEMKLYDAAPSECEQEAVREQVLPLPVAPQLRDEVAMEADVAQAAEQIERATRGSVDAEDENPVLWLAEPDEQDEPDEKTEVRDDFQLRKDDSDMLVIEDEIELRRIDSPSGKDHQPKTISFDFQAMLAKMRNGA